MFRALLVCFLGVVASLPSALAWAQGKKPAGDKYALLVGVRQYDKNELRDLTYSEPDVVELAKILRESGYRRVVLMTQTAGAENSRYLPLAANIRKELAGLLEDREEGDTVLVSFAGHGVQFAGDEEAYFCPMDTKLSNRQTLIALSDVYRQLEKSTAGFKLLLVDACRNDPQSDFSRSRAEVRLESVTRPQSRQPPGGVVALFSCSAGQKAFESPQLKHGVFFHFVIEGLKGKADSDGDRLVDLDEFVRFTKKQVTDAVKDEFGADIKQIPEQRGSSRGVLTLATISSGPGNTAPPPSVPAKETDQPEKKAASLEILSADKTTRFKAVGSKVIVQKNNVDVWSNDFSFNGDKQVRDLALGKAGLFVVTDKSLYCLDTQIGRTTWSVNISGGQRLTVAKEGQELHLTTATGSITRYDVRSGKILNP